MEINTFNDIQAWQAAHKSVLKVYRLAAQYPKHELFGLASQTQRCAVFVPSNIAEGFRRNLKNDSLHFYSIARASLEELK